jgi:DNA-binding IclR family transcriptional regulator
MSKNVPRTVHAVHITCNIIDALQELNGAGVTELANRLGHSKSTIHSHLRTLEEHHLVVREETQYRLSLRFLDVSSHVRDQFGNYDIIRNELENLAEETGEVAQFGVEEHGQVSYLYKVTGAQGVETASSVGTQQSIHSTSLGKAILAHLTDDRVHAILDETGLPGKTENTITDRAELFEELERVRSRGYATDDEENVDGLRCIAAPVMGNDGILGAVSVSGPSSRFSGEVFTEELPMVVKRAANVIELNSKFA